METNEACFCLSNVVTDDDFFSFLFLTLPRTCIESISKYRFNQKGHQDSSSLSVPGRGHAFVVLEEEDTVLAGRFKRGQMWQNGMILVGVLVGSSFLGWLIL